MTSDLEFSPVFGFTVAIAAIGFPDAVARLGGDVDGEPGSVHARTPCSPIPETPPDRDYGIEAGKNSAEENLV